MFGSKFLATLAALTLLASACNGASLTSTNHQVESPTEAPTDYPTPYPDTPAPPKIDAPLVESPSLTSIQFLNSLDGWGVTETQIVRTNDGGISWYDVTPKVISELGFGVRLSVLDTNHVWLQKADTNNYPNAGFLYRTTDGGITWTMFDTPFSEGELSFIDGDNGWVLANLGIGAGSNAVAVFQTEDGGSTWKQTYSNDPNDPIAGDSLPLGGLKNGITPLSMQTAWVGGIIYADGTIYLYRTDDTGRTWTEVNLPLPSGAENDQLSIGPDQMRFVSSQDGFLVMRLATQTGDYTVREAVYITHDGGDTWALTPTIIPDGGFADFLSAEGMVIYNGSQFYVTRDAARTWNSIAPDVNFSDIFMMMDFVDPSTGWVVTLDSTTNHRMLYKTGDGGTTWFPIVP